jgi:hypothetical protein
VGGVGCGERLAGERADRQDVKSPLGGELDNPVEIRILDVSDDG